jgi:hypothetical protein
MLLSEKDHPRSSVYFADVPREGWLVLDQSDHSVVMLVAKMITLRTAFPSKKCSRTTTALTALGSSNVKKANPRDVPAGSRIIVHASTFVTR